MRNHHTETKRLLAKELAEFKSQLCNSEARFKLCLLGDLQAKLNKFDQILDLVQNDPGSLLFLGEKLVNDLEICTNKGLHNFVPNL